MVATPMIPMSTMAPVLARKGWGTVPPDNLEMVLAMGVYGGASQSGQVPTSN